jgi:hypothetical protein
MFTTGHIVHHKPWNKGKIAGQKAPFKPKDPWVLRVRLQMEGRVREIALVNLVVESKLRGCDLVAHKVRDVCHGEQLATRAIVLCSTRPNAQFSLRSRLLPETHCRHGSSRLG